MLFGHLHVYARHKPLIGLTQKPLREVGKGAMLAIINGHSGTEHYFPGDEERVGLYTPFVDAADTSGPTYVILDVDQNRF